MICCCSEQQTTDGALQFLIVLLGFICEQFLYQMTDSLMSCSLTYLFDFLSSAVGRCAQSTPKTLFFRLKF